MNLTPKQQMFVKEYLIDLNATQAAIRAGYSAKTAGQIGEQNLNKLEIATAIQEAMNRRAERIEITADSVLQEIAKLAFHDPRKFFNDDGRLKTISELDENTAACIAGIETSQRDDGNSTLTKIKIADKGANLERLGRHLKLFTDKIDTNLSGSLQIEILKFSDTK